MRDVIFPWDAEGRASGASGEVRHADRLKTGTVLANVVRSPFGGAVQQLAAPEGSNLVAMIEAAFADPIVRRFVVARIDGVEIPVALWRDTRPSAGQVVELALRPGDGIGDFLRVVLQIAVMAAAAWVGAAIGGVWGAIASAGVTIGGNLLINALVPLSTGRTPSEQAKPFWSITGARNQARPYDPFPVVFGRHRYTPPVWGLPVQETDGNNIYLRYVFNLGPGPIEYEDLRIGETPIGDYDGVDLEWRLTPDAPAHTLYTGDPSAEAIGALVATDFDSRTTAADVDEIEVVLAFPAGLGAYNDEGRKQSRAVVLTVEYRLADQTPESAWVTHRPTAAQANAAAAAAGQPYRPDIVSHLLYSMYLTQLAALGGGVTSGNHTFTRSDPGNGFQDKIRWAVPRGQYDVRIKRTVAESTDAKVADSCTWAYLKGRNSSVDAFPIRDCASLAMRIKASDELNGVIDTVNLIVRRMTPGFSVGALADPLTADASDFTGSHLSRSPADLALWWVRGPHCRTPKPDDEINWPQWAAFAKWCFDENLHFDDVLDRKVTRGEMLARICSAGFARPVKQNGKLGVIIDRPQLNMPALVFTPRNVRNFRWEKSFPPDVHAVRVQFANDAIGWAADELIHYLPGYGPVDVYAGETLVIAAATKIETLEVPGKTDAEELHRVLAQYTRNARLQTKRYTFEMDVESLTVNLGAFVLIQHDAMAVGIGSARVRQLLMDGDDVAGVRLDAPIETPEEVDLESRWRITRDGAGNGEAGSGFEVNAGAYVVRDEDDPHVFMFAEPLAPEDAPQEGWPFLVGELAKVAVPALVRGIETDDMEGATITCVEYAEARFDPEDLPEHEPIVGLPVGGRPTQPLPIGPIVREAQIALAFEQPDSPHGVRIEAYDTYWRETPETEDDDDDTWNAGPTLAANQKTAIFPAGDPGGSYDVKIVGVGVDATGLYVESDPLIVTAIAASIVVEPPLDLDAVFRVEESPTGTQTLFLDAEWTPNANPEIVDTLFEYNAGTEEDPIWLPFHRGRFEKGGTVISGLASDRDYEIRAFNVSRRGAVSEPVTLPPITAPAITVYGPGNDGEGSNLDADKVRATTPGAFGLGMLAGELHAEVFGYMRMNRSSLNDDDTHGIRFDIDGSTAASIYADNAGRIVLDAVGMVLPGDVVATTALDTEKVLGEDPSSPGLALLTGASYAAQRASLGSTLAPLVILVSGQSNSVERPAYAWVTPSNLARWNWDGDVGTVGTAFAPADDDAIGLADSAAAQLARANPLRTVHLINVGLGGTPIEAWLPGGSPDVYAAVKDNVEAALGEIGVFEIDGFVWWQGESDQTSGTYQADFEALIARLRGETWFRWETPTVLMGVTTLISDDLRAFNANLTALAAAEPDTRAYVHTGSLPEVFWEESAIFLHMNAAGYEAAGRLAAKAMEGLGGREGPRNSYTDPFTAHDVLARAGADYIMHHAANDRAVQIMGGDGPGAGAGIVLAGGDNPFLPGFGSLVSGLTAALSWAELGIIVPGVINLGHVSDTTLSRLSAGVLGVEGATVFTTANDGPGSAFDADTLDGYQAAAFAQLAGAAFTGNVSFGDANFILGLLSGDACIVFDSGGDTVIYDRSANEWGWTVGSTPIATLAAAGFSVTGNLSAGDSNLALGLLSGDPFLVVDAGGDAFAYDRSANAFGWLIGGVERAALTASGMTVGGSAVVTLGTDGTGSTLDTDLVRGVTPSTPGLALLGGASYAAQRVSLGSTLEPFVLAVSGQSNAVLTRSLSWTPPSNLRTWNGSAWVGPDGTTISLGLSAAAEFARNNPLRLVCVVINGFGGAPISAWLPDDDPNLYDSLKEVVEDGLAALSRTRIDALVWWQGEADFESATYRDDFEELHARWREETWFPHETPLVMMGVTPYMESGDQDEMAAFNAQLAELAAREASFRAYVHTGDLPEDFWAAGDPDFSVHMTADGYLAAGRLAAMAFSGLQKGRGPTPYFVDPFTLAAHAAELWNFASGATFGDANISLSLVGDAAVLLFDAFDGVGYDRSDNTFTFTIAFTQAMKVSATGLEAASGVPVWTAANDGPTSTLDADLLDGYHAASFALLAGAAFTGTVSFGDAAFNAQLVGGNAVISFDAFDGIGYDRTANLMAFTIAFANAMELTSAGAYIPGVLNLGHASDTTLARASAGDVSIEGNLVYRAGGTDVAVADGGTGASTAAAAATNLGLGTGDSPQFAGVNLGHASDTTLTRGAAGVLHVEGAKVMTTANDGTGSLFDADLWDGNEFASYLDQAVKTGSSPSFVALTLTGAFTSLGIDDNATGERLELSNTAAVWGVSGANWLMRHAVNDMGLEIFGGNAVSVGAGIVLAGGAHAVLPGLGTLMSGSTQAMSWNTAGVIVPGVIELGHTSDTTFARIAAGRASIEGHEIATLDQAQTFTGAKTFSAGVRVTGGAVAQGAIWTDGNFGMGFMSGQSSAPAVVEFAWYNYNASAQYMALGAAGLTVGGNKVMHVGNDGTGSLFDADLLDGFEATAFMRLAATQTVTGVKTFGDGSTTGQGLLIINGVNSGTAQGPLLAFQTGGVDRLYLGAYSRIAGGALDLDPTMYSTTAASLYWYNGSKNPFMHAANDGAGSGFDADLLDGYHASAFALLNGAPTFSSQVIQSGGAGTLAGISIGRTGHEYWIGTVGSGGQFFTGTVAGDNVIAFGSKLWLGTGDLDTGGAAVATATSAGFAFVGTTSFGDASFSLGIASSNPVIQFDTGDAIIYDRTGNLLSLWFGGASEIFFGAGGSVFGAATGGAKGVGTINAKGVYDDNTLLTDLVLDFAVDERWDRDAYKHHPIANDNVPLAKWWFDIEVYEAFWRRERRLPGMRTWKDEADKPSVGEIATRLTAVVETQAVQIASLHKRLKRLEAIIQKQAA